MTTINTVEKSIEELDKRFADSLSPDNRLTEEFKEALRISFTAHEQEVMAKTVGILELLAEQIAKYNCGEHKKLLEYIETTKNSLTNNNQPPVN